MSLTQDSKKCIVNAYHGGGWRGGLTFVIVLPCSINVATLKIVLCWKFASHHHPDFDCTHSPALESGLDFVWGRWGSWLKRLEFVLLLDEYSSVSHKPLHSTVSISK